MRKKNIIKNLIPVILFVLVETSCAYSLKKDSATGNISKYIEESDNKDQNDFNNYDFTNDDFYNMMLNYESQINEMLESDNAYIARDGKDSYSFELTDYKKWNENELTDILELAKKYINAMKENHLEDAQKYASNMIEKIKHSIIKIAFIAEDNQYDSLTRLLDKPVESDVLEEDNKIIYKIPDENGIEREYVFTAIGHNNNAFNTLTAFDLSAYNQGEIKLDKSPIELVSNFLKTAKQSIYYDTLQTRDALNVTWSNDTQRRTYTKWFYDTAELKEYYKKGFAKAKEDLGYDPENSRIIINNDINGFFVENKDNEEKIVIKDDNENPWIVLTSLCDIQGLALADSETNQGTYNTSVDYENAFQTVERFIDGEPNIQYNIDEESFQYIKKD